MPLTTRIRNSTPARRVFALLLLCVLAIRVAIPTGFMPIANAHGITISVCTGQGAVTAFLPIPQREDGQDHHGPAAAPCAFAIGLGGPLLDPTDPALRVTPASTFDAPLRSSMADMTVHRLAAPPPPAQGPPSRD
ncbi:hypothetical protein [Sphingomonas hengshuiensis]|uniref:DUF2946 domain-containing protein n=1 Tax=Sphingomonas hengshuiensis TaxID=1609977 RepID=A0A7U4JBF7_9SPHN|nr:hypothetical protein [Sphingomonas hengshuiensis]AJP73741.1 hypothetical protein TS85_20985 [Sphingomonas hengshuiensis]